MQRLSLVSVIIVNYNVKFFLEQCLIAVGESLRNEPGEIIVFDNASIDGSREYLEPKFPNVRFIWNDENLGFGKANNRALKEAKGDIILFLNPDTIIGEGCLQRTAGFLRQRQDVGALGVRMIDGSGSFLKESKRAYPSVMTSFYKLCGLCSLFPSSPVFANYYLGQLDQTQTHEVDVLAGAFMMVKKEVLVKTGGFDEQFFMYGEDIDLSYRIQKAGYKNYYYADETIIHFKGESTRRGTLNYIRLFYSAMIVFVGKHYKGITAGIYRILLNLAIWIRASVALVAGFTSNNRIALFDGIVVTTSYLIAYLFWLYFEIPPYSISNGALALSLFSFSFVFITVLRFSGLHERRQRQRREVKAVALSGLIVFLLEAYLVDAFRFSPFSLFIGSVLSFFGIGFIRQRMRRKGKIEEIENHGLAIVGELEDMKRIGDIILPNQLHKVSEMFIRIPPEKLKWVQKRGDLSSYMFGIINSDLVLCRSSLSYEEIIRLTTVLPRHLRIRFHGAGSASIVGSDSGSSVGITLSEDYLFQLGSPEVLRMKRLIDFVISLSFLALLPILVFFVLKPAGFCRNIYEVFKGKKTWVGYIMEKNSLPKLLPGVIGTDGKPQLSDQTGDDRLTDTDVIYAKDYSVVRDIRPIIKGFRFLGYR